MGVQPIRYPSSLDNEDQVIYRVVLELPNAPANIIEEFARQPRLVCLPYPYVLQLRVR